ncbi:class A beta-lactamase [Prosthecomicrobium sp. N25]|uniref:class A beta-lactamase n=1 Tax=Prosthecomicrobium sp. N25 TaxID=3129254 RepID=UPI0030779BEC
MITRRQACLGIVFTVSAAPRLSGPARAAGPRGLADLPAAFARIETAARARLGVTVVDTGTGAGAAYRGDERFPLCSTFKALAAAAVLKRVDEGREDLARRVVYGADDLVTYSPGTERHVGAPGLSLAEIAEAAVTLSDNTAGNLLLRAVDGPSGLTAFLRAIGDGTTRLDRWETALNDVAPGDPRDTTTPNAMTASMRKLVLGDVLSAVSRERLAGWLVANKTGDARLRAGLPRDWRIGDKTGSGERGTANDVAVAWPPGRAPVIVTVYLTDSPAPAEARNAAIADVGRAVAAALAG